MFIQRGRYCSNATVEKLRDLAEINVFLLVYPYCKWEIRHFLTTNSYRKNPYANDLPMLFTHWRHYYCLKEDRHVTYSGVKTSLFCLAIAFFTRILLCTYVRPYCKQRIYKQRLNNDDLPAKILEKRPSNPPHWAEAYGIARLYIHNII